ncbi:hypothetical protein BJV74DRAFT_858530 [Russula compacta]|nr:hypothetical protein BJV74DRAFT_858530 [Russula compacta]
MSPPHVHRSSPLLAEVQSAASSVPVKILLRATCISCWNRALRGSSWFGSFLIQY